MIIVIVVLLLVALYCYTIYVRNYNINVKRNYVHKNYIQKNKTNVGDLFSKYPLYARRMICLYNKQNYKEVGSTFINNLRMAVNTKAIYDELPYDLIQQLKNIDINDHNISEIEKPSTIKEILSDSSYYKILELDEQQLKTIEEAIDNMIFLDSHLYDLNPIKPEAESIIKYLQNNFQEYLYHFTHKENLEQIKEMGGLYSWVQLDKMGKPCQHPGGDFLSRKLDTKYGVADYVHLSFSYKHPMSYRIEDDIVILFIHPIVCLLPETLFCNMNATDKDHTIGSTYKDLANINLWTPKMGYLSSGTRLFKEKQAEVLVKSHIPLEYIVNINLLS